MCVLVCKNTPTLNPYSLLFQTCFEALLCQLAATSQIVVPTATAVWQGTAGTRAPRKLLTNSEACDKSDASYCV
jgi:hypothetical protein